MAGVSGEAFTIQGETSNSGSLGTNELGIVNRSGGLINANVAGLFLLVDPNAASGLTNTGIMQASDGGLLRLTGKAAETSIIAGASSRRLTVRRSN